MSQQWRNPRVSRSTGYLWPPLVQFSPLWAPIPILKMPRKPLRNSHKSSSNRAAPSCHQFKFKLKHSNKLEIVSEFDTNVIIQTTVNNIHSNCKNIRLTEEINIIISIELYQDKFILYTLGLNLTLVEHSVIMTSIQVRNIYS